VTAMQTAAISIVVGAELEWRDRKVTMDRWILLMRWANTIVNFI